MKRSEAIEIMYQVIQKNCGKRTNDETVLHEILEALEESGVMPPISYSGLNQFGAYEIKHEWEKE